MTLSLHASVALLALSIVTSGQTAVFHAGLSGDQVVPPSASAGLGTAELTFDPVALALSGTVDLDFAGATAVRVRDGSAGTNGPVVFDFAGGPLTWTCADEPLTAGEVSGLFREGLYLEVESTAFPAGEVRGKLRAPIHLFAGMVGGLTVPPSGSSAVGGATLTLQQPQGVLDVVVDTGALAATGVTLNVGSPGVVGPVLATLSGGPTVWTGTTAPLSDIELYLLESNGLYVNVTSAAFPAGEIRGPVEVGFMNANVETISVTNGGRQTLRVTTGPGCAGMLYLLFGSMSGTQPGFSLGQALIPVNPDPYFAWALAHLDHQLFTNPVGYLDAQGDAVIELYMHPISNPLLAGIEVHHAFAAYDFGQGKWLMAGNAVKVTLIP